MAGLTMVASPALMRMAQQTTFLVLSHPIPRCRCSHKTALCSTVRLHLCTPLVMPKLIVEHGALP